MKKSALKSFGLVLLSLVFFSQLTAQIKEGTIPIQ
jgi:hypothetical protein